MSSSLLNAIDMVELVVLYLADGDDENREDEDRQGHPGHVGFETPGLGKVPPALVNTWSHFRAGEDENLKRRHFHSVTFCWLKRRRSTEVRAPPGED